MKYQELKPCPFCGANAYTITEYESDENRPDGYNVMVECKDCNAI